MQCSIGTYFNEVCKNSSELLMKSIKDFNKEEQLILKLRSHENISAICEKHEIKYLQKYEQYFGKKCCDPFNSHHTRRVIKRCLREITLSLSIRVKFIKLIPGTKVCSRCRNKIYSQIKETKPNLENMHDFSDKDGQNKILPSVRLSPHEETAQNNDFGKEMLNDDLLTNDEKIKEEIVDERDFSMESETSFFEQVEIKEEDEDEEEEEYEEEEEEEECEQIFVKEEIQDGLENYELMEFESAENSRENNYIYQLLMTDPEGEFQIAAYDFESDPTNCQHLLERTAYFDKNKVAKRIVFHEFKRINSYQILPNRLAELAKSAVECFPRLKESSFYSSTTENKSFEGVLNTYYLKQRKKEIAIGRFKGSVSKRKRDEVSDSEEFESVDCRQELKGVKLDNAASKLKWRTTNFEERVEFYEKSSIDDILETFPNLMSAAGPIFIESDYLLLNNTFDNFEENWPLMAPKIISLARKKAKTEDGKLINILLKENGLDGETNIEKSESNLTVALMLLPHLFKEMTKESTKSEIEKLWKPTYEEVSKGFIYHTNKETKDLNNELARIQSELISIHNFHSIELRPYVVINGPSLNNITSAHVIVGKWCYRTSSTMKAIDLCFKCTKLFQKSYSVMCDHIWQFLETAVYKLKRDRNSSMPSVMNRLLDTT